MEVYPEIFTKTSITNSSTLFHCQERLRNLISAFIKTFFKPFFKYYMLLTYDSILYIQTVNKHQHLGFQQIVLIHSNSYYQFILTVAKYLIRSMFLPDFFGLTIIVFYLMKVLARTD